MSNILKKINIKSKKQVFSSIIGNSSSKIKGEGYDFVELREYDSSDDAKKIDWTISAKFQKPYVKLFYEQRELNIAIVPILGGSVYFGTTKFKQELITEIVSILGFISIKESNSFSSFIANSSVEISTKKSKSNYSVIDMSSKLYNYDPINKEVDYHAIATGLYRLIKQKSIIFLIGDFFDADDIDLKLLAKKHEVVAIVIRDKFEETLTTSSSISLIDPSTSSIFEGSLSPKNIENYQQKVRENDKKLQEHFNKCGIKSIKIYTDEEPIVKIAKLLT
jgi:uncharacterized protein (DUF58 family)